MTVIVIPVDGATPVVRDAFPDDSAEVLSWLRAKVGGPIERVGLSHGRDMWISETGKLDGLPSNLAATALALVSGSLMLGDVIAGVAVITAHDGPETTPLSAEQVRRTWAELVQVL